MTNPLIQRAALARLNALSTEVNVTRQSFDKFKKDVIKLNPIDVFRTSIDKSVTLTMGFRGPEDFSLGIDRANSFTVFDGYVRAGRYSISAEVSTDVLGADTRTITSALISIFPLKQHKNYSKIYYAYLGISSLNPQQTFENGQKLYGAIQALAQSTARLAIVSNISDLEAAKQTINRLHTFITANGEPVEKFGIRGLLDAAIAKLIEGQLNRAMQIANMPEIKALREALDQGVMDAVLDK